MKSLNKIMSRTMMSSFGIMGINFVTGVLVARVLAPAGRGEISAISTWSVIMGWACSFGFTEALVYMQSNQPEASKRLLGTALFGCLLFGTFGLGVSEIVLPFAFKAQTAHTLLLGRVFMITIYINLLTTCLNGLVTGNQDFDFSNLQRIVQPSLYVLGILALWVTGHLSTGAVLFMAGFSGLITASMILVRLIRTSGIGLPSIALFKEGMRYGLRLQGAQLSSLANARLDIMIMPSVLVASQIGLYSVATNLSWVISSLLGSLSIVIFPAATRAGHEEGMVIVSRALRLVLLAGALLAAGMFLLAPVLLHVVYGAKFDGAMLPLRILLPGVVMVAGTAIVSSGLQAIDKPEYASYAQLAGLAVTLAGLYISLKPLGIIGASITSTASYTTCFVVGLVLLASTKHFNLSQTVSSRAFASDIAGLVARVRGALPGAAK